MNTSSRRTLTALSLACALGSAHAAGTPPVMDIAAQVSHTVRDCRTFAWRAAGAQTPNMCNEFTGTKWNQTVVEGVADTVYGGSDVASHATHWQASGSHGSASSPAAGSFVARNTVISHTPYTRVGGSVSMLQSFTWDGTGPATRAVAGSFEASGHHFGTNAEFESSETQAIASALASVTVFSLETSTLSNPDFEQFGALWLGNPSGYADYRLESYLSLEAPVNGILRYGLDGIALSTGRTYFVDIDMTSRAKFGARIDNAYLTAVLGDYASGQFTAGNAGLHFAPGLDDPYVVRTTADIVASPVPEPSLLLLSLTGLCMVGAGARRRQH